MGSIYRIMPKNRVGNIKQETYIGFNDSDNPLNRVEEHMRSAYGLDSGSSGRGSALIGKYGASQIVVDVWDAKDNYGIPEAAYLQFCQQWDQGKLAKTPQGRLNFAEICWILFYENNGGWNIGLGDRDDMSSIEVQQLKFNTGFFEQQIREIAKENFDWNAASKYNAIPTEPVNFHLGDRVDMKLKLFKPVLYTYTRAMSFIATGYCFFNTKNPKYTFPQFMSNCMKVYLETESTDQVSNYIRKFFDSAKEACKQLWNSSELGKRVKAEDIQIYFDYADVIQKVCRFLQDRIKTTYIKNLVAAKEISQVLQDFKLAIGRDRKSVTKRELINYQSLQKITRNVYATATLKPEDEPSWWKTAKRYMEKSSRGHNGTYDMAVIALGREISYKSFSKVMSKVTKNCPIKEREQEWTWEQIQGTVFYKGIRKVAKEQTLRIRMKQAMTSVGKIEKTASFLYKWDIYYRQCMTLWLGQQGRFLRTEDEVAKFSFAEPERYSLSFIGAVNTYGFRYWFKKTTWDIISYSYQADKSVRSLLYW